LHINVVFYAENFGEQQETGKTPKLLIDEMLLGEIKNSLIITADTLQQIADRFKFPDISSFGQFFKRQTGMSPKVFRERYK
jgi:AraC-like DNA-binding protein